MPVSPVVAAQNRFSISRILRDGRLDQRGKRQALWNYILTHELTNGTQFLVAPETGGIYAVIGATNQILQLPRAGRGGDAWHSYFQIMYGLGEREDNTKWLYDVMRSYVIEHGQKVELRRYAVFKRDTMTAYISTYNGRMYKIEGAEEGEHSLVSCGEDGVFFADDDGGVPYEADISPHGILLDRLANPNFSGGLSGITPEQQRMALIIWFFSLAFPDAMPTKPILMVEGVKGSGKTSSVVMMQLALMGRKKPMMLQKNKEDDFAVILLRSPIALFDNTDSYIDWVPDAIANYCTGGVVDKRRLYTDDESLTIRPHAFIAIATRNPASFRRDDVADRCVILRLDRRTTFRAAESIEREIAAERSRLVGEYLWYVGKIVTAMRESHATGIEHDETHRMADFAAFARHVAKVMDWPAEDIDELMLALQRERDAFINEEDPLIDLLEKWINYKQRDGRMPNVARTISLFSLHSELEFLATGSNIPWRDSPRALAQKLRSTHIERSIRIEIEADGKGGKNYRLWRASDPRLEIVG